MKLVITEKPSVAKSIAKVIGADKRGEGFLEGNGFLVSWCIGHLVELSPPEVYDEKLVRWRYEDLPILPKRWQYQVQMATKKQFDVIEKLIHRNDVQSLICATDAGREGELIFRLVYQQCHCKKPVERLWISSMEDGAIRDGFENLRSGTEYDSLYEAAVCRERADWIIGINATRLLSCLYGQPLPVGRVMTPTLSMVVEREKEILRFQPESFYTVSVIILGMEARSKRYGERLEAEKICLECKKRKMTEVTKIQKTIRTENPPLLYDLTTLQREANELFGYTALQTLEYAQALYEKKLLTYPRTDSRYLTKDMLQSYLKIVQEVLVKSNQNYEIHLLKDRIVNNNKVTDHPALLVTALGVQNCISALPEGEKNILEMVLRRMVCAAGKPYRFEEVSVTVTCAGEEYLAKGKTVLERGWRSFEKDVSDGRDKKIQIPKLKEGQSLMLEKVSVTEGKTEAPKHYTEASLLLAMESAGKKETTEFHGIGTPATRAGILEKLVQKGYLERRGEGKVKQLLPTKKGNSLIEVVPEQLRSAVVTVEWEKGLNRIEQKMDSAEVFMQELEEMVSLMVFRYEFQRENPFRATVEERIGACPCCSNDVVEREKGWFCVNGGCHFALWKNQALFQSIGKPLTASIVKELLERKETALENCESKRTGKRFDTVIRLAVQKNGTAGFEMDFGRGRKWQGKLFKQKISCIRD